MSLALFLLQVPKQLGGKEAKAMSLRRLPQFVSALAALALCAMLASSAHAAAISIADTADTITVSACDFEFGFSVNGIQMGPCGVGAGGSLSFPEANGPVTFNGTWTYSAPADNLNFTRTIYLVEAGAPSVISDVLTYTVQSLGLCCEATISGTFTSDFENNLGLLPVGVNPADVFIENGRPVPFGAAFLSGEINSDADTSVPEPGTLVLLASGLAGLGVRRYRRKSV